jgi:hypothetical protein
MFLSSSEYPSGKITEIGIEAAKDDQYKHIKAIYDELEFHEELTYGKILKRKDNGEFWHLNPKQTRARFITNEQVEFFRKWDVQPLIPTDEQFKILKVIGGIPSSPFSLYPDHLEFPAQITTKSGRKIDFCLFIFSQSPPFGRNVKETLFLSDVAKIAHSEFALNHDLRLASTLADEIRMGFYPFTVKTNTGGLLTYNGRTEFASTGKIKGEEVISEIDFSYSSFDKVEEDISSHITIVVGKWDNRLEQLFNQYNDILKEKETVKNPLPQRKKNWVQKLFKL